MLTDENKVSTLLANAKIMCNPMDSFVKHFNNLDNFNHFSC